MEYMHRYGSALGQIFLAADDVGITGLWFAGQKCFPRKMPEEGELPVFALADRWLDLYFSGRDPAFVLPLHLKGTPFQMAVWEYLQGIPYGSTVTYGEIAKELGCRSAQAVGNAVGRNPISILVPCHRVVGAGGNLTGYAGGLERKAALLGMEKAPI